MRCALHWFIPLAAVSALLVDLALGQAVFGGILGTVTDPSGAAVPNADITITDTDRGINYQTKSNADGNYSQTHLLAGHYKVKVSAAGFAPFEAAADVQIDAATRKPRSKSRLKRRCSRPIAPM